jgi:predicted tellurium resistance membrane protein TerC
MFEILISLFTLIILEVVLGIDNLVFLAIISNRLPVSQQKTARRLGLSLALLMRLILLAMAAWIASLTTPIVQFSHYVLSTRDIFFIIGGLFLLYKSTTEIHAEFAFNHFPAEDKPKQAVFSVIILQIVLLDIIFSLDSIFTAVGMTQHYWVMSVAIIIAMIAMILASESLCRFIQANPTIKMLALSYVLLIGVVLVADGLSFHVPRGYLYFAIVFSLLVEMLNLKILKRRKAKLQQRIQDKTQDKPKTESRSEDP